MTEQNLGVCQKEQRMHVLNDFRLKKTKKDAWPVLRCVYCEELLKNHG